MPLLCSQFFSMVLSDSFTDSAQGVWIQSMPGLNLFNASQFKPERPELMFTVDTAFIADNHQDTEEIITCFSKSAN